VYDPPPKSGVRASPVTSPDNTEASGTCAEIEGNVISPEVPLARADASIA
jgi:hypothetical protein